MLQARSPMRIVGVDPELGFAGGETQVLGLSLELRARGHQVELLCDPRGELWRRARQAGVQRSPLAVRNSLDLLAGLRLRRFLRQRPADIVHFHTARAHALAPFAAGLTRARIVTRRMDYRPNRLTARWLYNRAVEGVAAISEQVARSLTEAGVARDRIAIVPSGVDCAYFRPPEAAERAAARHALGGRDNDLLIGAVGSLEARKGHRYLLDALALLSRNGLFPRVLLAGEGSQRQALQAQADAAGLAQRVTLLGGLADVRELFWAIDIFVHPSTKEGLGVALLEAMACGQAVVASAAGGIPEIVEHERSGWLVAPGEASSLAQALAVLADSPQLRARMGEAARLRIVERFSLQAMGLGTMALYQEVLRRGDNRCAV
jgi:glycosyltransferase involved in cell wall biosynthesis